jgi:hypothetical protein
MVADTLPPTTARAPQQPDATAPAPSPCAAMTAKGKRL